MSSEISPRVKDSTPRSDTNAENAAKTASATGIARATRTSVRRSPRRMRTSMNSDARKKHSMPVMENVDSSAPPSTPSTSRSCQGRSQSSAIQMRIAAPRNTAVKLGSNVPMKRA